MSDQPEEELLTLHVQVAGLPGSPRIPLRVPRGITSAALRRQVCGAASVPPPAMRLIYRGRMIPDSEAELAVPEYKLEDGSVLHCMGKPVPKEQPKEEEQQPPLSALPSVARSTSSDPGAAAALAAASPSGDRLSVAEALRQLRQGNSAEAYATGVRTLDKVLGNIVRHPMEERYRAIKAGNPAFRSRLGGLDGAGALLRACGFDLAEAGAGGDGTQHEEQWVMQASAESWPVLLENKAAVEAAAAAAEGGAPAAAAAAAAASSSSSSGHPASASDPLGSALSDPAMLLQALQDPSFLGQLMESPEAAEMLERFARDFGADPAAAQSRVAGMMRDPRMRAWLGLMNQRLGQQLQQQQPNAASSGGIGGPAGAPNLPLWGAGIPPPPGSSSTGGPAARASQQSPGRSDEEMTEEEMIAEAIRRSLQDGS